MAEGGEVRRRPRWSAVDLLGRLVDGLARADLDLLSRVHPVEQPGPDQAPAP